MATLPGTFLEEVPQLVKLDVKDKKLLSALSINVRLTPTYLGSLIGLSKDSVRYRIKKLQSEGIILGNALVINPFALGLKFYSIFLRVTNLTSEEEIQLLQFLMHHPFTIWCGIVSGEWDIAIHLFCKDSTHFNAILKEIKTMCGTNFVDAMYLENVVMYNYGHLPAQYRKDNNILPASARMDTSFQVLFRNNINSSKDNIASLDVFDKQILKLLAENPGTSIATISEKLKVSFDTVKNRISHLISNKLIVGFYPLLKFTSIGLQAYVIFIETSTPEEDIKFKEYIATHPNGIYILKSNGEWDWHLYVAVYNHYDFYKLLRELRSIFSYYIKRYSTLAVVQDFKFSFVPDGVKQHILADSNL